jgi:DNA-binding transcriptional LysR family regulator
MLNVNRLRILSEVAHRGSFSAAADALSYTQSAVSQQIATLEAETGMTLLERRPRGVSLTAAGQTLVVHAESVLADLDAAETALQAIAGLRGGRLRMASFPTAGATLMPLAIATFRTRHPGVELTLAEGEPEQIAPRLAAGELDLALLFEFDPSAAERSGDAADGPEGAVGSAGAAASVGGRLTRVELLQDPLYLALPRAHPLAQRRRLRLGDLREEAWIQTSQASPCARHVVRCCHAAGFEPNVSFQSDDYQTVQGLVGAGVGVALIPELALSVVREDIVIRALSPRPPARRVIAATAAGARLLPAAPAMLSVLEQVASEYQALGRPSDQTGAPISRDDALPRGREPQRAGLVR